MATVLLTAATSSIAASAGVSAFASNVALGVAATAGSYLDSKYVIPFLFPPEPQTFTGRRTAEFTIQTASEGAPIPKAYGTSTRLSGEVIWISPIIEETTIHTTSIGTGKNRTTSSTKEFVYFSHIAVCVGYGQHTIEKIWANGRAIWDSNAVSATDYFQDIRVYNSSQINPDPLIESFLGVNRTPAYTGFTYVVFERFGLNEFGSTSPTFSFALSGKSKSISGVLDEVLTDSGISSSDFTIEEDLGPFGGLRIGDLESFGAVLETILDAYNLQIQEGETLAIGKKYPAQVIEVSTEWARSTDSNLSQDPLFEIEVEDTLDLPSEVNMTYVDPNREHQLGSQRVQKADFDLRRVVRIESPLTLDSNTARKIANRKLWSAWVERRMVTKLKLPPSSIRLQEGDVIALTGEDEFFIRVLEISRGANRLAEVSGYVQSETIPDELPFVDLSPLTEESPVEINAPPSVITIGGYFFDAPALVDNQASIAFAHAGYYTDPISDSWPGATLKSPVFREGSQDIEASATVGDVPAALGGGVSPHFWDETNSITVDLKDGILVSSTRIKVLNGENIVMVGDEVIGFVTATLVSGYQYILTDLLRGLRGTEWSIDSHTVNERFILLASATLVPVESQYLGSSYNYDALAVGADPSDYVRTTYNHTGVAFIPYAVANLVGEWDGTDWVFSWNRRTRYNFRHFVGASPKIDSEERYKIVILAVSGSIKRTVSSHPSTIFTYTAAMQAADWGGPKSSSFVIRVYEIYVPLNITGRRTQLLL